MEEQEKYPLLVDSQENQTLLLKKDKCDKYDYLVAVACGAIGGMIDIFLVGAPKDSILGNWTDKQVDNAVRKYAKLMGWNPKEGNSQNTASAIGFLEQKYKVNYDQRSSKDVGNQFALATKNHHMKSLAHSPSIVGLFFSLLNQFTGTSTFIDNGKIITVNSATSELIGGNFISKIFCGIANWFGHIMSDIAGSKGSTERGTGVVIPFYELFGLCKVGSFTKDKNDFATIATKAFQKGYDFRFGLTMAIPVVITDLSIRLIWAVRQRYQYQRPLKECIPTQSHADLRVMLLIGNGTLCVMDAMDAGIRSGGNFLNFFMRLNLIAWFRFIMLVIKEVCLRIGIRGAIDKVIEAYQRINQELLLYLNELEKIDIDLFEKETEEYNKIVEMVVNVNSQEELNVVLLDTFNRMGWKKPWEGDFDEHMSDKNGTLVFE